MAQKNSVVIQDLTYTAKQYGLAPTVTYVNGSALSVSVSAQAITVTIISGTTTATAIAAAVNANVDAAYLVTVTISGTGSTAQVSFVSATLSGGTVLTKSVLTVGGVMRLTAHTGGTAGNSIRFKFTSGATAGSEAVTVSSSDITVQIADGVSTYAQVKAALEADGGAAALVDVSSAGKSLTSVALVASMSAFTNLAGGTAAVAASVVVQGVTITASATGVAANGKTVTCVNDGTAGAETVTVSSGNVTAHIQSGTSTVTQIRTALNNETTFSAIYAATGTASTTPKTVNAVALAGAVAVGSFQDFYKDQAVAVLTTSFVFASFGFLASGLIISNDDTSGSNIVVYSFDGTNTHGTLKANESIAWDEMPRNGIWLKYTTGAAAYRVFAKGQ